MNVQQQTLRQPVLSQWTFADRIAEAGLGLAVLAGLAAILSGLGTRWVWWYFMTGLTLLRVAAIGGIVSAIVSLAGGVLARHEHRGTIFFAAAAGILVGLLTAGIPWSWAHRAEQMPLIHDITTDMTNPPQFKAIMPLRVGAENAAVYSGPETASQQMSAYPDIRPLVLSSSPASAFDTALVTAKNMGWQIVDSNANEGRMEAIATTFWFGFKDDIIVRVTPGTKGSIVDIRSTSRVGLSDIGTNAQRVRSFLQKMNEAMGSKSSEDIGY
jgi:uncharacterized protein (DUF1499 family)